MIGLDVRELKSLRNSALDQTTVLAIKCSKDLIDGLQVYFDYN